MDFGSLQTCIYNRLIWINQEIRKARQNKDEATMKRFLGYRKETDRLLSKTKETMLKDPDNAQEFERLSLLYRSQSLI